MLTSCTGVDYFNCLCTRTVKTFVQETMLFSDHLGTALKLLSSKRNFFAGTVLTVLSIFLFWWTLLFPNNHVIYCSDQVQKRNKVKCLRHVFEHFLPERDRCACYSVQTVVCALGMKCVENENMRCRWNNPTKGQCPRASCPTSRRSGDRTQPTQPSEIPWYRLNLESARVGHSIERELGLWIATCTHPRCACVSE